MVNKISNLRVERINLEELKTLANKDSKYQKNYDEYKYAVEYGHFFYSVRPTVELNREYDEYLKSQGKDGLNWDYELGATHLNDEPEESSSNALLYGIIGLLVVVVLFLVFRKKGSKKGSTKNKK